MTARKQAKPAAGRSAPDAAEPSKPAELERRGELESKLFMAEVFEGGDALTADEQAELKALLRPEMEAKRARVWFNFSDLVAGRSRRQEPLYVRRTDGVALVYPGKEHTVYGETEAGKGMFLAMAVAQLLTAGVPVAILDYEEGDGEEWGSRLLALGVPGSLLTDRALFRYSTPESIPLSEFALEDALNDQQARLVIFEGVSACYGLYGWQIKENDSATEFRSRLVKPCLSKGAATIASDHVTKASEGRGRYAIGGVMKLNMVSGAAYMLELTRSHARGQVGTSKVLCTKDRPGKVKAKCSAHGKDPSVKYVGTLRVDSTEEDRLIIDLLPPPVSDTDKDDDSSVDDEQEACQAAVLLAVKTAGEITGKRDLCSAVRVAAKAAGHSFRDEKVMDAADDLTTMGKLARSVGGRNAQTWQIPS